MAPTDKTEQHAEAALTAVTCSSATQAGWPADWWADRGSGRGTERIDKDDKTIRFSCVFGSFSHFFVFKDPFTFQHKSVATSILINN